MKGFMDMMKQAEALQTKMKAMQDELVAMQIVGEAGAGMVRVTVNGQGQMLGISIDPSLLNPEEVEILEDLVVAAHTDAKNRLDQETKEKMQEITGGLPLPPGLKLF